ncbi:UDP-N-acetylmuramoyl-tripeptide--D-alanyl-D-alanine ligase [Mucilaginibacter myungsuensis]|uniref:UDP-N-acetylmuramoyl-tripeptide--D-alanyl-D-alanine ligase n=1 Tax=Mucilaginibacter myungsuensis TaxID=649104 RepID=A0A929PUW8_9SPHI|nr:UDP-N-acetylmuramoyl-tripeptide--D-alanyl-D-alanine ligase [Mucilaginibacter myungsuensis]MBE9661203.1 UDP-N-acetylmuramoyl-tripeptide--D-alanyl-D-alanine ligase [Mucilaginibacter myungsuensis]MDN3597348.1 UDP-N-acetylmuramoyl-tripeptide--D-alanyl-D-alanine ligase [Mucilaginibacter myungsuensis]
MTTTEQIYQHYQQNPVISTDTRKITPGCIFFALKGDKFDANTFAPQAVEQGAAFAIIDNAQYRVSEQFILVDDVLETLQDVARLHRKHLDIPVIGLTGTNGKTTTKELINAVLSQRFNTLATQGNLNNHIGVPLTILGINNTHEMAVIEMGANHQREIELLCSIAQPSHGLITNVGRAHLEGFGGVEGVKIGKGEMYDHLQNHNGVAFINSNDATLMEMQAKRDIKNIIYFGDREDALISGKLIANAPFLSLSWTNNAEKQSHEVSSQLTGEYNLDNILIAISIGTYFNLTPDEVNAGIANYQPKNNRSQLMTTATNTLVCDYYNANPSSMAVAIDNISKLAADKKVLILGDMFELGDDSAAEHAGVIQKAMDANVTQRIFIGEAFYQQSELINADFYRTAQDAIDALKAKPIRNATVLIKGSRGMALERLVELM